jgi:hypothetical protein
MAISSLTLLTVKPASAQTSTPTLSSLPIPTPSVPKFAVNLVDRSYDVPATTTIDPYTGQTVNHPAHRVENYTVDVTIKNQPYTSTKVQEGTSYWTSSFVYDIRVKGHFAQDWIPMYYAGEGPRMSNSDYTVVTYVLVSSPTQPEQGYTMESYDKTLATNSITGLPPGAQIDFQVNALSGYWTRTTAFNSQHFVSEESGWSNTQTIEIPASSASPTPAVPEFHSWTILLTATLMVSISGLLDYLKKHKH